MRKGIVLLLSVLGVASAISCSGGGAGTSSASPTASGNGGSAGTPAGRPTASSGGATPQPGVTPATMAMTSSAFAAGGGIPAKYTCDGQGVSPPLQWDAPPSGTQSLALIVTDPDAPGGTYVHWVIYGLPASSRSLPENVSTDAKPPTGGVNGQNGAGKLGYTPPCPPSGTHHYYFRLYALDTSIAATPGLTADELMQSMSGHIVGQAELMGTYARGE